MKRITFEAPMARYGFFSDALACGDRVRCAEGEGVVYAVTINCRPIPGTPLLDEPRLYIELECG